jgi:RNA polymerase sigma-70 factor (ECF subfamily)
VGDEGVVDAARSGDRRALESLIEEHYDRVHALCRRMLGNDADALDATQDAMVAAIRALHRFDGRSSFGTWLYRIATNACIDELRRRRRRPVPGLADADPPFGDGPDRASPAAGVDPADVVTARLDVDAALRGLPVEFRTAVVLRDVCDLTYEDIAAILEVPVGTVRSRIARGRAALAESWTAAVPGPGGRNARAGSGNLDTTGAVRTVEERETGPARVADPDAAPAEGGDRGA